MTRHVCRRLAQIPALLSWAVGKHFFVFRISPTVKIGLAGGAIGPIQSLVERPEKRKPSCEEAKAGGVVHTPQGEEDETSLHEVRRKSRKEKKKRMMYRKEK